jgi:hypothetical protein
MRAARRKRGSRTPPRLADGRGQAIETEGSTVLAAEGDAQIDHLVLDDLTGVGRG